MPPQAGPATPTIVDIPGVGEVEFPASMSEAAINAAAKKLFTEHKAKTTPGVISRAANAFVDEINPMNAIRGMAAMVPFTDANRRAVGAQLQRANDHPILAAIEQTPISPLTGNAGMAAGERAGRGDVAGGMGQVAGDIANVGMGYGLGKVMQGTGAAMRWFAPKLMDQALETTPALRREFPNTPQRLVDEGLYPKEAQGALTEAEADVQRAAQKYDQGHSPAFQSTIRVGSRPTAIASAAKDFASTEGKVPALGDVPGAEAAELDDLEQRYVDQNRQMKDVQGTIAQKRAYAARARYTGARPNAPVITNNEINFNKGVAAQNRAEAIQAVPDLEGLFSREEDLIGAVEARKNAAGLPPAVNGATFWSSLRHLLFHPEVTSRGALATDRVGQFLSKPEWFRALLLRELAARGSMDERPDGGQANKPQ